VPTVEELMGTALMTPERLVIDMSEEIALLQPSAAPLTVLLKKMQNKRVATNPKFEWMEDDLLPWWDKIVNATGYTAADTVLKVANAAYFTEWDIVHVPRTGENMRVISKDVDNNTITVVRGWGSTAQPLNDQEPLMILGAAAAEGGLARKPNVQNPVPKYNYTQIFKHTVGVTRTQEHTKVYGPAELARQHKLKGIEHKVAIERAFLFGTRNITYGSDGQAIRTTGGLLSFLTENVWVVPNGVATEADFNKWLEDVFSYGSDTKWALASPRWCTTFDSWGREKLAINDVASETAGFRVKEYISSHGRLLIARHPLLQGAVYGGHLIIVDIDYIRYRPLEGRDTKILTNRQENDRDGRKDEYLTEAGIEVRLPKAHAVAKGLSVA